MVFFYNERKISLDFVEFSRRALYGGNTTMTITAIPIMAIIEDLQSTWDVGVGPNLFFVAHPLGGPH